MIISGMVKNSLIDYPGLIACVLFVPGCNYDCFYCHNRHLLEGTHEDMPLQNIEAFLEKRAGFLDGVVISGGEPTLQPDLAAFMRMLKKLGYKVKLDTNGSSPEVVGSLLQGGLCDYFAVDYKAPAARYEEICGDHASSEKVLKTIELLLSHHACFEVRTTVIPQLSDDELLRMSQELPILPRYVLNRYRAPEAYPARHEAKIREQPRKQSEIRALAGLIRPYQPNVIC